MSPPIAIPLRYPISNQPHHVMISNVHTVHTSRHQIDIPVCYPLPRSPRIITSPEFGLHSNCRSPGAHILENLGPASISDKTSYCKISRSLETEKFISELSDRSEIWQAHRQHCYRCACEISKRCDNLGYQCHGFETSRDLTIRRLIGYWKPQY